MPKLYEYSGIRFVHYGGSVIYLENSIKPIRMQVHQGIAGWWLNREVFMPVAAIGG